MLKKIIGIGLFKVIALLMTFIIGVIVSRVYGAEGKGELTLLLLIPTIITVYAGFSINEGFLYYTSKGIIGKSNFNKLLLWAFITFIPLILLLYVLANYLFDEYNFYVLPQLLLLIGIFFVLILIFSLRGVLNFKIFNLIQVVETLIVLIVVLFAVFYELDVIYLIWAYVLSNFIVLLISYYYVNNKLNSNNTFVSLKTLINYSYKVHFFKILNFTENKFDILIIGYFLSLSQVGIYSVSVAITVIFQSIVQTSISTVLLPMLIKSKNEIRAKTTSEYFKLSLVLALLFLIGLIVFGNIFIKTVYGQEFETAFFPMLILSVGALIKSPAACINSYFKASGRPEELYKTSIYTVTVNVVLCFLLIPKYGITGAAIASSISYFIYGFIMIYKFVNATNTSVAGLILIKKEDVNFIKKNVFKIK